MEDHPGTGVWSVVCRCSNVTVSTQVVTPAKTLHAYSCDCQKFKTPCRIFCTSSGLFICEIISIAISASWYTD